MIVNNQEHSPSEILAQVVKNNEHRAKSMDQQKERLKQRILYHWVQQGSIGFWNKCFKHVPLDVIREGYENLESLAKTGYPIRNKAALFVTNLRKMGYFPFEEVKSE